VSIIRGPRPETKFYTLDKSISEDPRLSWAARGLLIFLLGKPDHWEVSVKHLINQTKDALGKSSGRDGVRVILKELEAAGYLTADYARSNAGSFNGMAYTVHEIPRDDSPETENPSSGNGSPETAFPAPAKPAPANPHLVKNDLQQLIEKAPSTDIPSLPAEAASPALEGELIAKQAKAKKPADEDMQAACRATWSAYAMAYQSRYGAEPIRNAKVNNQVKQFATRIPRDEAPAVAAFYVGINDAFLVRNCHDFGSLLAKSETYRTQWVTGRQINGRTARQIEDRQANLSAGEEAARRIRERHSNGEQRNEFL